MESLQERDLKLFTRWPVTRPCDFSIVVGNKQIPCHRHKLAEFSEFFRAMLSSGFREDLESKVTIKSVSLECMLTILEFIYSEPGADILTPDNVIDVWHAAQHFQIKDLFELCEDYIRANASLDSASCFMLYHHAFHLESPAVIKFLIEYIERNFDLVSSAPDLLTLSPQHFLDVVKSRTLRTESEDNVVKTILKWVKYKSERATDRESRMCYSHLLFRACRLCTVDKTVLLHLLGDLDSKAIDVILEAVEYLLYPDRRADFLPSTALHRDHSSAQNVILSVPSGCEKVRLVCIAPDKMYFYLPSSFKSKSNPSFRSLCYGDFVYVSNTNGEKNIWRYTASNNKWENQPSMTKVRHGHAFLALEDFIYAVGGDERHTIERLRVCSHTGKRKWEHVGQMAHPMDISAATVLDGKIVIFGKDTDSEDTTRVQAFDPKTSTFRNLESLPGPAVGMACFRKGKEAFALQRSGSLWRLTWNQRDGNIFSYERLGTIWDIDRPINGVVLRNGELLVFSDTNPSEKFPCRQLAVPNVFKQVYHSGQDTHCHTPFVVQKRFLKSKNRIAA